MSSCLVLPPFLANQPYYVALCLRGQLPPYMYVHVHVRDRERKLAIFESSVSFQRVKQTVNLELYTALKCNFRDNDIEFFFFVCTCKLYEAR